MLRSYLKITLYFKSRDLPIVLEGGSQGTSLPKKQEQSKLSQKMADLKQVKRISQTDKDIVYHICKTDGQ